jgi:hypothetical protein
LQADGDTATYTAWQNGPAVATVSVGDQTGTSVAANIQVTGSGGISATPPPIPRKQCRTACMPEIHACRASCTAPGRNKCRRRCGPSVVRLCKTTGYCS